MSSDCRQLLLLRSAYSKSDVTGFPSFRPREGGLQPALFLPSCFSYFFLFFFSHHNTAVLSAAGTNKLLSAVTCTLLENAADSPCESFARLFLFLLFLPPCSATVTLDGSVVLLQELLEGERKLVPSGANVQMSVDRLPAQVLQAGQAAGEGLDQLQRDLLHPRVDVVGAPAAGVPFALGHVVVHQLEDTIKVGHRLDVLGVRLQVEGGRVALDAQVLGARRRLDAEREEVAVVRAVADEEGAGGLGRQQGVGLLPRHGAPVEAALLQLVQRGQHHLELSLGAERLVVVRQPHVGVQEAAAHRCVKLAVSYHGAVPAPEAASGVLARGWGGSARRSGQDDETPEG